MEKKKNERTNEQISLQKPIVSYTIKVITHCIVYQILGL